ncbi:hypothetical protein ABBQ32_008507 [Trebouxia sp. C0010 RCD-2024]
MLLEEWAYCLYRFSGGSKPCIFTINLLLAIALGTRYAMSLCLIASMTLFKGVKNSAALFIGPWLPLVISCVLTVRLLAFMMSPPLLSYSSGICRVRMLLVCIVLKQPHLPG